MKRVRSSADRPRSGDDAPASRLVGNPGPAQWRLRREAQFDGADLSAADLSGSRLGDLVRVALDRRGSRGPARRGPTPDQPSHFPAGHHS